MRRWWPERLRSLGRNRRAWLGLALLATAAVAGLALVRQHRAEQHLAAVRRQLDLALRLGQRDRVQALLEYLQTLAPADPRPGQRLAMLQRGHADAADSPLVRLLLRDHVRHDRLDEAAVEAATLLRSEPRDWEARCVLGHQALRAGDRAGLADHLRHLPADPAAIPDLAPGPLLHGLALFRATSDAARASALVGHLVTDRLPRLRLPVAELLTPEEKLQWVEGYQQALPHLDAWPNLVSFWVPVRKLCAGVRAAAPGAPLLIRLGRLEEAQLEALREFRRRGLLPEAEVAILTREVEAGLRATWAAVRRQEPREPAGYLGEALALERGGDRPQALAQLGEGLAACGPAAELVACKGWLVRQGDPEAGLAYLVGELAGRPVPPHLLPVLAETALAAGRPDLARAVCRAVEAPWAWRLDAQLGLQLGRPTEAAAVLGRHRAELGGVPAEAALYARALAECGAFPLLDAFVEELAAARHVEAGAAAARQWLVSGRAEECRRWADRLAQADPESAPVRRLRAEALARLAEDAAPPWPADLVHAALADGRWLLRRSPEDPQALPLVARLELFGRRDVAAALEAARPLRQQAERGAALTAEALEVLGLVLAAAGEGASARRWLELAARTDPGRSAAWLALAQLALDRGEPAAARQCLDRVAVLPRSPGQAAEWGRLHRILEGLP